LAKANDVRFKFIYFRHIHIRFIVCVCGAWKENFTKSFSMLLLRGVKNVFSVRNKIYDLHKIHTRVSLFIYLFCIPITCIIFCQINGRSARGFGGQSRKNIFTMLHVGNTPEFVRRV